ncbi:MBL fold metallo-hydrolase [Paenalcaligenes niemegkensis]|uniref:MBL fold metallo-hydrolase n=1 Tax=Paenalcaligenes niemegkensis TaxID=2895469 RepID=UPI001EE8EAC4|nr:MBL fold metallo-hydrolase [Paenalcaligenes niemegkensis]MCQ9617237.1 MBL fold metallo-hydrolase [Paenalcaligenes niemegkensis]
MSKQFASHGDMEDKVVSFEKLSDNAYAYTAEGDPNTGVIIGENAVMVIDTQATPVMAQDVIRRIREVSDKPINYILLSHYHAVRVLGASAYGAQEIIASRDTYDLIVERGEEDKASEIGRFPRLFQAVESVPDGLTWPTITFDGYMTVDLGNLEVHLMQVGRGHTKGDTIAWLPEQKILFAGDLVEYQSTPYAGDCYFKEWPQTLDNLAEFEAEQMVPGRGPALKNAAEVKKALAGTRAFLTDLYACVNQGVADGKELRDIYKEAYAFMKPRYSDWVIFDHCMPFDVARAYDEAKGIADPIVWTAQRDIDMWKALENS